MQIAIPVFDDMTFLDAAGPYEVLIRVPGAQVTWAGLTMDPVRCDGGLRVLPDALLEDIPNPDVLVFPGGFGARPLIHDERVLSWVRGAAQSAQWVASVCTGALVLGGAGLLEGLTATTHWTAYDTLQELGATPVPDRVVEHGNLLIGAGVSAGIDLALTLVSRMHSDDTARKIQLAIEYDPQPPFDAGSPAKAGDALVAAVRERDFS
jgi:putative intracellular protease/amidase